MAEKRFTLVDIGFVYDNNNLLGMKEIVELLNENEQLKHSIECLEADKMELQQYIKRIQGDVE